MTNAKAKQQTVYFESLEGWSDLDQQERGKVVAEANAASEALRMEGQSRLEVGKHLVEIRKILLPKRMWVAFLRQAFHMSERTAYNYITEYEETSKAVPEPVLKVAMERGYKAITRLELVKKNPPPKTADHEKIVAYLDKLEAVPSPPRPDRFEDFTVDDHVKICINFVGIHFDKLTDQKSKRAFIRTLIGMELAKFGISSDTSFSPIAIPDEFRVLRGRPKIEKAA